MNHYHNTNETGRSMMEMLGVLGIIGLLSSAGVVGYSMAMAKHRANVLLEQATRRAYMASIQFMKNPALDVVSLDEFKDNEFYGLEFSTEAYPSDLNTEQFEIALTEASPAPDVQTCEQMQKMVDEQDLIRDLDDECAIFTFNKDMARDSDGSGEWEEDEDDRTCPEHSSTTPTAFPTTLRDGTGALCYCNEGYAFIDGKCQASKAGQACRDWKTNFCGLGYYCDLNVSDQSTSNGAPTKDGTCTKLPTEPTPINLSINGHTTVDIYKYSITNWWTNMSLCIGSGREPVMASDLYFKDGVGANNSTTTCSGAADCGLTSCACGTHDETVCTAADLSIGCSAKDAKCNCWTYLKSKLGTYAWTGANYQSETSSNAFPVVSIDSYVYYYNRNNFATYALCKGSSAL